MGFYINTAYRAYILSWRVSINGIIFRAPTFEILTRALTLQPLNQGTKRVLHYYRGSCWCCTLLSWFIIHIHFWMLKSKDTKIQMMCAYSFIFLSQSTPVGFLAGRLSHVIILFKLIFQNRTFNNFCGIYPIYFGGLTTFAPPSLVPLSILYTQINLSTGKSTIMTSSKGTTLH